MQADWWGFTVCSFRSHCWPVPVKQQQQQLRVGMRARLCTDLEGALSTLSSGKCLRKSALSHKIHFAFRACFNTLGWNEADRRQQGLDDEYADDNSALFSSEPAKFSQPPFVQLLVIHISKPSSLSQQQLRCAFISLGGLPAPFIIIVVGFHFPAGAIASNTPPLPFKSFLTPSLHLSIVVTCTYRIVQLLLRSSSSSTTTSTTTTANMLPAVNQPLSELPELPSWTECATALLQEQVNVALASPPTVQLKPSQANFKTFSRALNMEAACDGITQLCSDGSGRNNLCDSFWMTLPFFG